PSNRPYLHGEVQTIAAWRRHGDIDAVVDRPRARERLRRQIHGQLELRVDLHPAVWQLRGRGTETAAQRPHAVRDRLLETEHARRSRRQMNGIEVSRDARVTPTGVLADVERVERDAGARMRRALDRRTFGTFFR